MRRRMTYLERLKKLNMHQGTTDKTDKSTSVSFVSPPQAQMDEHAEAVARQTRMIDWLNANPAPSAPDRCAGCGGADAQRLRVTAALFLDFLRRLPEEQIWTNGGAQDRDQGHCVGGIEGDAGQNRRSQRCFPRHINRQHHRNISE